MEEIRCKYCEKMLGKFLGLVEIKCPRCKRVTWSNGKNALMWDGKRLFLPPFGVLDWIDMPDVITMAFVKSGDVYTDTLDGAYVLTNYTDYGRCILEKVN